MNISTFNALMARGIDSTKAQQLISEGFTISSLKQLDLSSIRKLNISDEVINTIQRETRPQIPSETVIKLLYESKRTCCVCRDNTQPIIIHHIEEWHISKNNSESNLVVLCLRHHDEAHTKKSLSINLSAKQILTSKQTWLSYIKTEDARAILGLMIPHSRWDYINIKRLFELFLDLDIKYDDIQSYLKLLNLEIVDERGIPRPKQNWKVSGLPTSYLLDFGEGIYYTHYLKTIVGRIVTRLPVIDLTNNLNLSFIKSVVKIGSIITAQVGFYFSDIDKYEKSKSQLRRAYYQKNSIKIEFVFDAWECTSSSGRYDALTGHRVAVPIIFVRSVLEDEQKNLVINGSCLAIGTWFENHRQSEIRPEI